ncbi:MAG: DNA-protecting protein DprA, partial [Muribaculaceae bacterium]|nr:DNA-protecting protein DprA [Muribaculaceae bacterium]
ISPPPALIAAPGQRIDGLVVVSGLAYGIDVAAHRAALEAGVPTVAVVAHGLRTLYPADHRDIARRILERGGAIVTEYTSDAPVHRGNFLARNRIVAGLADALVLVESDAKGGAMVTASIASAYNRDVFALPGRVTDRYSRGANALIQANKAAVVRNADDLIEAMNWQVKGQNESVQGTFDFESRKDMDLSPEMEAIVRHLRQNPASSINDMTSDLGIPYSRLSSRIMEMEMNDLITVLPGGTFLLNI